MLRRSPGSHPMPMRVCDHTHDATRTSPPFRRIPRSQAAHSETEMEWSSARLST